MNKISVISVVAVLLSVTAQCQLSTERQALNNLEKGRWEKARVRLEKALRKDSTNITAYYVLSSYFFTSGNPSYQIDSAYRYVMKAISGYSAAEQKAIDKMKRFPIDSTILVRRRKAIDSAAFVRAKQVNTERAYLEFIEWFPFAEQKDRAKELRDEVAYVDALKENTFESFSLFLTKYPNASRANDARERYETLLFQAKTKDGKLISFKSFIYEFPESPYRPQAEFQVFEISTASGEPNSFSDYIKQYPSSMLVTKARNILYHILKEEERSIPASIITDSLRNLLQLERGFLVPFFKEEKFGFMNVEGKEIIRPFTMELNLEYRCGNVTEELLVGDNKLLARDGSVIFNGTIRELDDLGYGYLLIEGKECSSLIHKSGFIIEECLLDAKVIAGAYLAIRKSKTWTIKTLSGRSLPLGEFEDVISIDDLVVLKQVGKFKLIGKNEIAKAADQLTLVYSRLYDEVKRWNGSMIWARVGDRQALMNMDLTEKISLGNKEILPSFFGAVSKSSEGVRLWSSVAGESEDFEEVIIKKPWVGAKKQNRWYLLDQNLKPDELSSFDSVYFIGPFGMALKGDSLRVYVSPQSFIPISMQSTIEFLPGKDSTYYLLVNDKEGKGVYNSAGMKLFTAYYDRIEFVGENLFLAIKKEKRGLINLEGKTIVPVEYDAMGNLSGGTLPVLKDKKFGFMDVQNRKEIKPQYEKNLIRFSANYLIAFKGGHYGIVDWDNKPVAPFQYEEIRYWNDSTALVKQNFQWIIYNFVEKKIVADKIRDFKWLLNSDEEKLIIFHQDNNYGVISSTRGIVLPATYSDIVNLGSDTAPFYFTEKHVEEASIYVVIYYDENGKLVRRQVFEVDDYERIYCSKN